MQSHRGFYLVYVLAPSTTGTKGIPGNIRWIYFYFYSYRRPQGKQILTQKKYDAALRYRRGISLLDRCTPISDFKVSIGQVAIYLKSN